MNEKERARLRALGMMTVGYVEIQMRAMSLKIRSQGRRWSSPANERYSKGIFT